VLFTPILYKNYILYVDETSRHNWDEEAAPPHTYHADKAYFELLMYQEELLNQKSRLSLLTYVSRIIQQMLKLRSVR
jgi:hypothetical protein